jgi:hypothetical protein
VSFDQVVMDSVAHVTTLVGAAGNLFGPPPQSPAVAPTIDGGGGSGGGGGTDSNPQVQADLENLRQPLTDIRQRCQWTPILGQDGATP